MGNNDKKDHHAAPDNDNDNDNDEKDYQILANKKRQRKRKTDYHAAPDRPWQGGWPKVLNAALTCLEQGSFLLKRNFLLKEKKNRQRNGERNVLCG